MTQTVVPQSTALWELVGELYGEDGNIDSAKLTAEQWTALAAAGDALRAVATTLAEADTIKVAPEGVKLQNEGTPGAWGVAQVQAAIDADVPGFKEAALKLVAVANDATAAAMARDGVKADDASARLNEVCSACHNGFWYPKQALP